MLTRERAKYLAHELVLDAVVENRKDVQKIPARIAELTAKLGWDTDDLQAVQAATDY